MGVLLSQRRLLRTQALQLFCRDLSMDSAVALASPLPFPFDHLGKEVGRCCHTLDALEDNGRCRECESDGRYGARRDLAR